MPKQPETASETVPETAKHISIEIGRLFRPIALRPLRCGSAMPSAPLAAHRSAGTEARKARPAAPRCQAGIGGCIDLRPQATQLTARKLGGGVGYMPASSGCDNWLSLGQRLGQRASSAFANINKLNALHPLLHRFVRPTFVKISRSVMAMAKRLIPRNTWVARAKDRGGVGVGGTQLGGSIIDLPLLARAFSEKFRRPSKKIRVYK